MIICFNGYWRYFVVTVLLEESNLMKLFVYV